MNANKILNYEDPTYLGFQLRLLDTQDFSKSSGELELDYYPQGLFLSNDNPDSAYSYLVRTGQTSRAAMIAQFRDEFIYLLKNAPWYFTTVTGVGDIWKINPGNSFRGKEKKITIGTFEALDLKMTYLMDLYRKAVFDSYWMRYALPENQRMFALELVVGEIRSMHITEKGYQNLKNGPYPGYITDVNVGSTFKTFQNQVADVSAASPSMNNVYGPRGPEIALITNIKNSLNALTNNSLPNTAQSSTIKAPWSPITFLSFRFDYCTFDVFSNSPNYLESLGKSPGEMAKNSIVINTPFISEVNTYGLLGAVLKDSYYQADYEYNIESVLAGNSSIMQTLGDGTNNDTTQQQVKQQQTKNRFLSNLSTGAQAAVINLLNTAGTKIFLGNVYGLSAANILNAVQSLLNNPIATISQTIRSFTTTTPEGGQVTLGNVNLTGPELKLVKDIIGIAIEDGVVENPDLVKDVIGKAVEDRINVNPTLITKEKKNVFFTGPEVVKQRLGNAYEG